MSAASTLWLGLAVVALGLGWYWIRRGGLARSIERRFGGYRHLPRPVDRSLPTAISGAAPRVAVIGGGLAGIGAAATLGERGFPVTIYDKNPYLGGKIGAWQIAVGDENQTVEHGFHAFFRQYYNLNHFLERIGATQSFRAIEDYLIIDGKGQPQSFGDVNPVPGLNLLSLGWRGFYRFRDVVRARTRNNLAAFLRFDMNHTYEALDDITFKQFCDNAAVPETLRVSFRTFARAFFSDEADLSTAEVIRAFHFYYLSHDHGLLYDYPAGNYEDTLIGPIRSHLEEHGVELSLDTPVGAIDRPERGGFVVDGSDYDWVIIACDVPGTKALVGASPWIRDGFPDVHRQIERLRSARGYAVWRIWVDRDLPGALPSFVNFDRREVLDSVTRYHRVTDEARAWAERHQGAVLELHSYALPEGMTDEERIRRAFLDDLATFFPELGEPNIAAEALQVRADFPAFGPGQHADRPTPRLPIEGLLLAGDWVKLPYPMTHMEAAFSSGLLCANEILGQTNLRQVDIHTVAPQGLWNPL